MILELAIAGFVFMTSCLVAYQLFELEKPSNITSAVKAAQMAAAKTTAPIAKRFFPGMCEIYSRKIEMLYETSDGLTADAHVGYSILVAAVGTLALWLLSAYAGASFFTGFILGISFGAILYLGLIRSIERRLAARKALLDNEFPFFLDFVVMMKQAGATLPEAVILFCRSTRSTLLAREMTNLMNNQAKGPGGLLGALRAYEEKCASEVGSTALSAIIALEPVGSESSQTLQSLASDMRHDRTQRALRAAEGIKSKIMLPVTIMLFGVIIIILSGSLPMLMFGF